MAILASLTYAIAVFGGSASHDLVSVPLLVLKSLMLLGIAFVAGNLSRSGKRKEDDLVEVFRKIDDAILAEVETPKILGMILESAIAFTGSDMGKLTICGKDNDAYSIAKNTDEKHQDWKIESLEAVFHAKVLATKKSISVLTIKQKRTNGQPALDETVGPQPSRAKAHIYVLRGYIEADASPARAALFVPLILNDEVRAIISLYSKNSFHYFDIDALKLESLAPALGITLKHSAESEKTQRLKLLHRIGETLKVEQGLLKVFKTVVALAWTQLGSEEAALFVVDEKSRDEVLLTKVAVWGPTEEIAHQLKEIENPYKPDESLVGEIFSTKLPKYLPEVLPRTLYYEKYAETLPSKKVRHYIGVPIVIGDEVLGVLRVINKRSPSYSVENENFELSPAGFSADDLELMQTIASQVASAIRSAKFIELNRYYKELVENSPDPIIVLDEYGNVTVFNRACEKIWNFEAGEVRDTHVSTYYKSAEHAREIGKLLWNAASHRIQDYQAFIKPKDGPDIPISLSASFLFDQHGKRIGSVGVFKDLRDTLKLQEEKSNAERLATLGKLAHTVGHEIKHDIATALNYVDTLAFETEDDDELAEIYREIQDSLTEAVDKFQNMLLIGRPKPPAMDIIGAADVFTMVEPSMCRRSRSKRVDFRLDYPDETKELKADITQIRQVLRNLFDNSLDAIDAKRITGEAHATGVIECLASVRNGHLEIDWRDNGCGIPAESLDKIFTPFVTSKSTGNGLGLFIVKNIVENHGGSVTLQSESGKGTSLTIRLPLLTAEESQE